MSNKYIDISGGRQVRKNFIDFTVGSENSGQPIKTDNTGKLDASFLPEGIGGEQFMQTAGEQLNANDLVYISLSTGQVFKADANDPNKRAIGFISASYAQNEQVVIYKRSIFDGLTGIVPGQRYYLSTTPGEFTTTPLDSENSTNDGKLHQFIGRGLTIDAIEFIDSSYVTL